MKSMVTLLAALLVLGIVSLCDAVIGGFGPGTTSELGVSGEAWCNRFPDWPGCKKY